MKVTNAAIKEVCAQGIPMSDAAKKVGLSFNQFKTRALALGCYKPRQGVTLKPRDRTDLQNILQGKCPGYHTNALKKRLIETGIKEWKCERCLQTEWMGSPIPIELHHKNGNSNDHVLANLEILCPNCHAMTDNYRGKQNARPGGKKRKKVVMSDRTCKVCGRKLTTAQKLVCSVPCRNQLRKLMQKPLVTKEKLHRALTTSKSIQETCRKLGVSDPTIRKWSQVYGFDIKFLLNK